MSIKVLFELASAAVYDSAGILPMPTLLTNMETAMANMPPEEARKAKRKFRKMWRKLVREKLATFKYPNNKEALTRVYGLEAEEPTKDQKRARKGLVRNAMQKAAYGMVVTMKNPDKSEK